MDKNPLISICCITYNHGSFIRQCLDGFLMQQCNFEYEILIYDDASTDNTQSVIREYQEKYPEIIKPIFQEDNQYSKGVRGMMAKFNFPRAKGKYIALCEGDDYWTDPLKLQKQVDFLEANPNVGCCFTNAIVDNHIEKEQYEYNSAYKLEEGRVENEKIFEKGGGIYPTCTLVYRRELNEKITVLSGMAGDECLIFQLANMSNIVYMDFISAVYNRWSGGVFSGIKNDKKRLVAYRREEIKAYQKLQPLLKIENQRLLENKIGKAAKYVLKNEKHIFKNLPYIPIVGLKNYLKSFR